MPERRPPIHEQASIGFQRAADAYERGRPDYPVAAVEYLVKTLDITRGVQVVELGAGTGKFTRTLVPAGAKIVAVEPVEAMRRKLSELLPGVTVVDGTAETIPLPDATADAVVVAQAFHWFDGEKALPEIHRVLKPGRGLGLIWNVRDEAVGWIRGLTDIIEPYESGVPRYKSLAWMTAFKSTRLFSPLAEAEFRHVQTLSLEAVEDRVTSISFIAALPDSEREAVRQKVRELVRQEAENRGVAEIDFPYQTHVFTCRRL
jgi:ubiquinone/menaquinone biosynthesis C-methylase UbiE